MERATARFNREYSSAFENEGCMVCGGESEEPGLCSKCDKEIFEEEK